MGVSEYKGESLVPITLAGLTSGNFSGNAILVTNSGGGLSQDPTNFGYNTASGIFTARGGSVRGVTTFTGIGNYTMLANDYCIVVNKVTGAATSVLLLSSPETGREAIIKDGKADAGTNNITLSGNGVNIDGATTFVLSANKAAAKVIYNGVQWNVI